MRHVGTWYLENQYQNMWSCGNVKQLGDLSSDARALGKLRLPSYKKELGGPAMFVVQVHPHAQPIHLRVVTSFPTSFYDTPVYSLPSPLASFAAAILFNNSSY